MSAPAGAFAEAERLRACVHCGLCLAACPTYVALGDEADSPRGRIHLMRALDAGTIGPTAEVVHHLDRCLGCRACETACPSGVEYGRVIEAARVHVAAARPWPARIARRALAQALGAPYLGRAMVLPLRLGGGRVWLARVARRVPRRLGAWLALVAAGPGRATAAAVPTTIEPAGSPRGTAAILTGCAPATIFSRPTHAAARLLARAGVRVVVPPAQPCCGALALHLGVVAEARACARRSARLLAATGADWIVSTAAGCGAHLRDLAHLLPDEPAATLVSGRARDALDLLAELGSPPPERPLPHTVTVHDPCHLAHGQGIRQPVRDLLAAIPGIRLVELEEADTCCGSAGTYNLTEPVMARRLLDRKLDRVEATGAEIVAAANPGCLLQIRAGAVVRGLDVRIAHPLELLADAAGLR